MTDGLTIVIPAYNEANGIGPVLDNLQQVLARLALPVEVIVVDDGSEDNTAAVVTQYEDIRLVQHPTNRGYGAALKTGLRRATHSLACITDADGTYPNDRIPDLVQILLDEDCDMVVGARVGPNAAIPMIRRPAKWAVRKLGEVVAGSPIPDINSGLRVFRRDVALRFFGLLPDGFSFTTTITLGMLSNAYNVRYVPIDYHSRIGTSKIKPIRDTLNFVQLTLRVALYFAPLKIFIPLSLFLFAFAVSWGLFSIFVLGAFADDSTFLIAMTALQTGMLGLLAEIINHRLSSDYRENDIQ
jgi:glycosyltransferase involved in cell wall biosynthesis